MSRVYDFVASIGPNCRSAWNTQDFFGDFTTRPFDWWITPFQSTLELLKRRATPEFHADDFMQIMISDRDDTIYNRRLNLYHHHDFSKGPDGLSKKEWRDAIPAIIQKYTYLFDRFWQDFEAAERPLLVLGGLLTFHNHPQLARNGLEAPAFDSGTPPITDAARMVREIFPDKQLDTVLIFPGSVEIVREEGDALLYVGVDDGTRPDYMMPNAWQHPMNVFRDGFARLGFSPAHDEAYIGAAQDTVLGAEPFRRMRAGALVEKARQILETPQGDGYKASKYLIAAYQLNPGPELRATVESLAATHQIDLLAGADAPAVVELVEAS